MEKSWVTVGAEIFINSALTILFIGQLENSFAFKETIRKKILILG